LQPPANTGISKSVRIQSRFIPLISFLGSTFRCWFMEIVPHESADANESGRHFAEFAPPKGTRRKAVRLAKVCRRKIRHFPAGGMKARLQPLQTRKLLR